jgi:hypothetical protein
MAKKKAKPELQKSEKAEKDLSPYQQTIKDIATSLLNQENWPEILQDMLDGIEEDVIDCLETDKGVPVAIRED